MLQKIVIPPGIYKDTTNYNRMGHWIDGSNVRFRMGVPERIGGWRPITQSFTFDGVCRSLHLWRSGGLVALGVGTEKFYYVLYNGNSYEVTPLRATSAGLTDPFDTVISDATVTVTDTSHGAAIGDSIIISGASAVGGITPDGQYEITSIVNDDEYTIEHSSAATSTATGGGTVTIQYILSAGLSNSATSGWGAGVWGGGSWGQSSAAGTQAQLGLWTQASWGEDVVICARNAGIAYYDTSGLSTRATLLSALGGAADPPDEAVLVVASTRDRHMIALGASDSGGGSQNKMLVRWCSQEDLSDWDVTSTTNTAGEILLDHGSEIVSGRATRRELLIWTDLALYSMNYIGAPFIFGVELLAMNTDIAGINCPIVIDDIAFWVGFGGFYAWTGQVEKLQCPIWDYIDQDIDWSQSDKIYASVNRRFTEIIWLYPSEDGGGECDKYVCYEYKQNIWYYGSVGDRTAWIDNGLSESPIAADTDGQLYDHEVSADDDDGSTIQGVVSYIESAPFEITSDDPNITNGNRFGFVSRILHDFTFRHSDPSPTPQLTVTLKSLNYQGEAPLETNTDSSVSRSATSPVELHTTKTDVRLRGRALVYRIDSSERNSLWRMGSPRVEVRLDGRR